jgi:hypothetical protein
MGDYDFEKNVMKFFERASMWELIGMRLFTWAIFLTDIYRFFRGR